MPLPSYHVGPVHVEPALVLAPMSGVTDSPFRQLVKRASGDAVGMLMTEFISIELLTGRHLRSFIRMSFSEHERPVGVQLYGSDADRMAEAARMAAAAGADLIDINCGCPAPKVVRRGGGAGLLRDLPNLARILDAVVPAVSVPVTIKIRNGWCEDSINALETLRVAEGHGARAVAVHGRTRAQLYRGEADWEIVRAMKGRACVPVIGSGDVLTAADARRRFDETGCDGIMIGRGAITNPWIFRQIADQVAGRPPVAPTWREVLALLAHYHELLLETYPPKVAPGRLKMMLSRLLKGLDQGRDVRKTCLRLETPREMLDYLARTLGDLGLLDRPREAASSCKVAARAA